MRIKSSSDSILGSQFVLRYQEKNVSPVGTFVTIPKTNDTVEQIVAIEKNADRAY